MTEHGIQAWLSLGANVGDRERNLREALRRLRAAPGIAIETVSGLYETPPWGDTDQGPFLNAVAGIHTSLSPHALLDTAKMIELALGREETRRWGPRLIDIDIVHMAGIAVSDDRLTLPHRHWRERAFVLMPLAEIAPELVIEQIAVTAALAACDGISIRRLEEDWTP